MGFAGSAIMELMMVLLVLRGGRQQQPMPRRMKVLATVYVLFFASLTAVFVAADWNLFIDPVYDYGGPCGGLEAANDC